MNLILIIIGIFFIYEIFINKIRIDFKSFFHKGFKRDENAFGLYCYTGKQGTGKTMSAVKFLINQKHQFDYKIITNVRSFSAFDDTMYISDILDIIDYVESFDDNEENIIIFFDEIFTVLEKNKVLSKKIMSFISQLRKRGIILVTTAQEWSEINITFRRYCRYQISCNMFTFPFLGFACYKNDFNDGYGIKWNNDDMEYQAPKLYTKIGKCSRMILDYYDTYETI